VFYVSVVIAVVLVFYFLLKVIEFFVLFNFAFAIPGSVGRRSEVFSVRVM
jgi:hypothetical protein